MKKLFLLFLGAFLTLNVSAFYLREPGKILPSNSVCYAGNKVHRIFIPPPVEFYNRVESKQGALISVNYIDFPDAPKAAFNHAVSILESLLPEGTLIRIKATWANLTNESVLANSSAPSFLAGWGINALNPYAYYPVALGEKIAGRDYNGDNEADIELTFNSSAAWYFGTDGTTPVSKYDMVTVVLHELIHGLGFVDSMTEEKWTGSYGLNSIPLIYDTFIESLDGKRLTDTTYFENPSPALKQQFTSRELYFNSPLLSNFTSGKRAKLYAPAIFDPGSSIAHLDEKETMEIDQLMTPFIDLGEAIHNPGKLTMSMLGDMGWINTRIVHEELKDTEDNLQEITISAEIKSDTIYDHDKVGLVYAFNGYDNPALRDTAFLAQNGDNNYSTTLTIPYYGSSFDYYLFAEDYFSRVYRLPSYIEKFHYSAYIGVDTVKPVITYSPQKYYFETIDSIFFDLTVSDNIGVDTVYLEYRLNQEDIYSIGLISDGKNKYTNVIDAEPFAFKGGDTFNYRIIAVDEARVPNTRMFPGDGKFFTAQIENINNAEQSYSTNFIDASSDFFFDGMQILKPKGFTNYGIHTPHPYESPEETGDSIGYTAMLRTPVIYDEQGMIISYKELVLVEPGEDGFDFWSSYFYDYVIVEGSKDYGKTWFPLVDGYDSRINNSWLEAYNGSLDGDNSTFIGTGSMMTKRTIFPRVSSYISNGDPMMIRFRLFSDPYANGWGWAIEDLHIGPIIDKVEDIEYYSPVIYPNPGQGYITINKLDGLDSKPVKYRIYNSVGFLVKEGISGGGNEINLDISDYPAGLYLIVLHSPNGIRTMKYILTR
jgi:hypothetical protein